MTNSNERPNLQRDRVAAGQTYKRRRARTAADELLSISPDLWDEHTKRVVLVTLPSLIYAALLARYGEPQPLQACTVEIAGDVMCGEAMPCADHSRQLAYDDPDPYAKGTPADPVVQAYRTGRPSGSR